MGYKRPIDRRPLQNAGKRPLMLKVDIQVWLVKGDYSSLTLPSTVW